MSTKLFLANKKNTKNQESNKLPIEYCETREDSRLESTDAGSYTVDTIQISVHEEEKQQYDDVPRSINEGKNK